MSQKSILFAFFLFWQASPTIFAQSIISFDWEIDIGSRIAYASGSHLTDEIVICTADRCCYAIDVNNRKIIRHAVLVSGKYRSKSTLQFHDYALNKSWVIQERKSRNSDVLVPVEAEYLSSPFLCNDSIYIIVEDRGNYAISSYDTESGETRWRKRIGYYIPGPLEWEHPPFIVESDSLYAISYTDYTKDQKLSRRSHIYSFVTDTGKIEWQITIEDSSFGMRSQLKNVDLFIAVIDENSTILVDKNTGVRKSALEDLVSEVSCIDSASGNIYTSAENQISAWRPNGESLWTATLQDSIRSFASSDSVLYVVSESSILHVVDVNTGEEKTSHRLPTTIAFSPIVTRNEIAFVGDSGVIGTTTRRLFE